MSDGLEPGRQETPEQVEEGEKKAIEARCVRTVSL